MRLDSWRTIGRVLLKTAVLFLLLNALFAWLYPLEALGRVSLYNGLLPGRERLPYGENPAESHSLSLYNVPAMLASHAIHQPKAADEFRVLLIGDSGTWGWFLENDDTLAGQLNALGLQTTDGRTVRIYNFGYPVMALSKDLLLLDAARQTQPDLILWPVTLESFPRDKQLFPPLVQNNPTRMGRLIQAHGLELDVADGRFVTPAFLERTIVGQRRNLADWLRLQQFGFAWAATGIDQAIPAEFELRRSDFAADVSWQSFAEPVTLTTNDLAFDVLAAGMTLAGDAPVLLINEPMFISSGQNSDLRYNAFYPRWAYDQYREMLAATAVAHNWPYLDLWDTIPPNEFTDTPVHLTAVGNKLFAELVAEGIRPFLTVNSEH
jgi:lysophospholipase L1-like esterase